jgi:hypothetical protein
MKTEFFFLFFKLKRKIKFGILFKLGLDFEKKNRN